ncbi:MAG: methyltransferase domain-containing protein [Ilumatobacteraceae bacterium]
MSALPGRRRYGHIGAVYDAISLERWLYRQPRERLHDMIGPQPGATIVDVGCGTGLNFEGLVRLVGPAGRVIGLDASPSMLAAATRRTRAAGWDNVFVIEADIGLLAAALCTSGIEIAAIDVVIATFVVATLRDPSSFWRSVDEIIASHPCLVVALADIGPADATRRLPALVLNTFAALGGNHLRARPWNDLARRSPDVVTEQHLGGHVHLAVGTCDHHPSHALQGEPPS